MDFNVIGGVVRAILPPTIAYLVAKGTLPAGDYDAVITAIIALGAAIWSVKTNVKK